MKCQGRLGGGCSEVCALHVAINLAARLRSVGIRRFEFVARRLAGYDVAMEVAR